MFLCYGSTMKSEHLERCQVATPHDVVSLLWALARGERKGQKFGRVIDLGAGDARFAQDGRHFHEYLGVERDESRYQGVKLPVNATILHQDALDVRGIGFDLCIGNPPYIRHHHLEPGWRNHAHNQLKEAGGPALKLTANLYVLFLAQALLLTKTTGLVVQLIPFEWVTRPSAAELRDFIRENGWGVKVYRFKADIFPTVLTTASITIIDKSRHDGEWLFGEIGRDGVIESVKTPTGNADGVLPYAARHERSHALRGLSPGGQEIFVLTEEQRLFHGLRRRRDVVPCVTTLKSVAPDATFLDTCLFEEQFIRSGRRCWLIRSDRVQLSEVLKDYLKSVGEAWKAYSTCTNRGTWWQYRGHPIPDLLVSSGFVGKGPKVLVNTAGAIAVGSVYGVIGTGAAGAGAMAARLRAYDFRRRVVHHANNLKKIEVNQLNAVLHRLVR
ncbi:MAG: hypothetical protein ABS82_12035 [Rhodanobacter sp. SCN 67-45]|nr:MAG: hypothetical protein ABS82_12035 [Rhodanobacter sp. SCN 67-45]